MVDGGGVADGTLDGQAEQVAEAAFIPTGELSLVQDAVPLLGQEEAVEYRPRELSRGVARARVTRTRIRCAVTGAVSLRTRL